jgi:hypothetical protein
MVSITTVSKFKTNTAEQLRVSIPKEVVNKMCLVGKEKALWRMKGSKVILEFFKNE